MDGDLYQDLKDYGFKLLSFRPRSIKELRGKLNIYSVKKRIPSELVDKLLLDFADHKFVDDRDFGLWWINQRHGHKPKGARAIKIELLQKGVDKEIINSLLKSENSADSEFILALETGRKKINFYKKEPLPRAKKKLSEYLLRRGFEWPTVSRVIDELFSKSYNTGVDLKEY